MQGGTTSVDPFSSFADKYSTVSGFSDFTSALLMTGVRYIVTQTYISDLKPITATESGALASAAATNPNVRSVTKEVLSIMSNYVATQTILPKEVRDDVKSDYDAMYETGAVTTTRSSETKRSSETVKETLATEQGGLTVVVTQTMKETPSPTVTVNAGIPRMDTLSVSGLLIGLVVAVAGAL
jgi:hypothetical protein